MTAIVVFLILISVIIVIHELGHYSVARLCGVRVLEFSLGMGPKLFGVRSSNGTLWKISAFPIGGYVRIHGQEKDEDDIDSYSTKNVWQRMSILFAGPLANTIFTLLIFSGLLFFYGQTTTEIVVQKIVAEGKKENPTKIQVNDVILSINDVPTENFAMAQFAFSTIGKEETSTTVSIKRNGKKKYIQSTLYRSKENKISLGVQILTMSARTGGSFNFFESIKVGSKEMWTIMKTQGYAFGALFTGLMSPRKISGPIGIAKISGDIFEYSGIIETIYFAAFLSLIIGLINLLPIPILDGGHLFLCFIEIIKGSPVSKKVQRHLVEMGFFIIITLAVLIFLNDINNLFMM